MPANRVISLTLSLTLVLLVYSSVSMAGVFALPPDPGWTDSANCTEVTPHGAVNLREKTCCWRERVPGQILGQRYCQTCTTTWNGNEWIRGDCKAAQPVYTGTLTQTTPTPTPLTPLGPLLFPEDGVLQQPTPAPTSPLGPRPFTPLGEGTIQEPPLFGRNTANNPLGGGVLGQPLTTITPTTPAPTPPTQFGQIAPETQAPLEIDEGTLPPTTGEQVEEPSSEEQGTEEDEQVIAKEDDDSDDDDDLDDVPFPPKCPPTGPIPPNCTLRPFPDERTLQ